MSRAGWLLVAASAVVVGAIALGLFAVGTPGEARRDRLDMKRLEDLRMIAGTVAARQAFGAGHDELGMAAVARTALQRTPDPGTGEGYRFRARPGGAFELGARFDGASRAADLEPYERAWAHGAGDWWFVFGPRSGGLPDSGYAGPAAP